VTPPARRMSLGLVLVAAALVAFGAPSVGQAQGSCEVNNQTSCNFGNTAGFGITVAVTSAVRLTTSASTVTLETPDGDDFEAGFGTPAPLGVVVRANLGWTLSIASTQATWTAAGAEARPDRPVADLQWGTVLAGPFTDMTTSNVTMSTGAATGGTSLTLYLRARYQWLLDSPGDYSVPVQLTLTAP
jgi:hypothetical protein